MNTHVVVIAGGAGTRFWPSGRSALPKQLLPIMSDRTMLAETLARCEELAPPERTWIVINMIPTGLQMPSEQTPSGARSILHLLTAAPNRHS